MREQRLVTMSTHLVYLVAPDDLKWCQRLDLHLYPLQKQGLLSTWSPLDIPAGVEWQKELETQCTQASFLILLLSASFFADPICFGLMEQALSRQSVQVIPVLLRPVLWTSTPIAHLPPLPANGRAIALWSNRDAAFFEIAQEISRRITGVPIAPPQHQGDIGQTASLPSLERDRQQFLHKLHGRYDQAFAQALQGNVLIPIPLQTQPAALANATHTVFRHLPQKAETLPERTSLLEVYDTSGGELLILGEPGSGKSTLLLHMAQGLLTRADRDGQQLFPVIFNLASWTEKHLPLRDWLFEELYYYEIPHKLRHHWIDQGQILPLLDGIDEVPLATRPACIEAINAYRRDYLVPLIVCGRTTEYLEQPRRLMLQTAVLLQPLTPAQVTATLDHAGSELATLRDTLQKNIVLQKLASSPFLLNIMMFLYRGTSISASLQGDAQAAQQQIFASYLHRTLSAPEIGRHQPPQRLLSHLIWLAQQMKAQERTEFYLERLPADWLSNKHWQRFYSFLAVCFPGIIIGSLVCLAVNNVLFQAVPLIDALLLGAGLGAVLSGEHEARDKLSRVPSRLKSSLAWFGIGFCTGLLSSIWRQLPYPSLALIYGLIYALTLWSWYLLRPGVTAARKTTSPDRHSSLSQTIRVALSIGLPAAVSYGLTFGPTYALVHQAGWVQGLQTGLIHGVNILLIFTVAGGILHLLFLTERKGRLADRLGWSWKRLGSNLVSRKSLVRVISFTWTLAVGMGLYIGVLNGILNVSSGPIVVGIALVFFGVSAMLIFGLSTFISAVLTYQVLFGVLQGMASETIDDQDRALPNEGIHHSIRNALLFGLVSLLAAGLIGFGLGTVQNTVLGISTVNTLLNLLIFWLPPGSTVSLQGVTVLSPEMLSLSLGLSVGFLGFLCNGGLACWQHSTLRFLFWRMGVMPRDEVSMLDEGARHILLYRVGGGYFFIHRLFRNYLANLQVTQLILCVCGYVSDRPATKFCSHCGKPLEQQARVR